MSAIEDKVCAKIQKRAEAGLMKYGVTLERKDLNPVDWLNHLQEELMDACGYIEALLANIDRIKEKTGNDHIPK